MRRNTCILSGGIILASLLGFSSVASADSEQKGIGGSSQQKGYIGLLGGGNVTDNSEQSRTAAFGLTAGALVAPNFGVGFFGSYYGSRSNGTFMGLPTGASTSTTVLTGQGNFFMGGFHAGAEIGTAISSWSGSFSTLHSGDSTTAMVYGPQAGFDLRVADGFSVGAEGHYLITTANGGVNNVQLMIGLKAWM